MPPSWRPVPACAPRLCCRRAILRCDYDYCRRNCSTLRRRKLESDAAPLRLRLLQAGHSTCRHDGSTSILDFRPRLANQCSQKVKTGAIPPSQGSEALCGNTAPCPQAESAAEQKQLAAAQPLAEGYDEIAENGHAYY